MSFNTRFLVMTVFAMVFVLAGCSVALEGGTTVPPIDEPVNLLLNPGFENDLQRWGGGNFSGKAHLDLDTEVYRSGSTSARVTTYGKTDEDKDDRYALSLNPRIPVNVGETYRFEAWIKTDLDGGEAYLRIGLRDSSGTTNVGPIQTSQKVTGQNDWQLIGLTFTIPETVVSVHGELYSVGGNGRVWWDDVAFYLVEE